MCVPYRGGPRGSRHTPCFGVPAFGRGLRALGRSRRRPARGWVPLATASAIGCIASIGAARTSRCTSAHTCRLRAAAFPRADQTTGENAHLLGLRLAWLAERRTDLGRVTRQT